MAYFVDTIYLQLLIKLLFVVHLSDCFLPMTHNQLVVIVLTTHNQLVVIVLTDARITYTVLAETLNHAQSIN